MRPTRGQEEAPCVPRDIQVFAFGDASHGRCHVSKESLEDFLSVRGIEIEVVRGRNTVGFWVSALAVFNVVLVAVRAVRSSPSKGVGSKRFVCV